MLAPLARCAGWNGHDDPADAPPSSPENGDYNNDGKVDGLDYLVWASNFEAGTAVVAVAPASQTASAEELDAVDAAFEDDYDTGTMVADDLSVRSWQTSSAFDSALRKLAGRRRDSKRVRAAI